MKLYYSAYSSTGTNSLSSLEESQQLSLDSSRSVSVLQTQQNTAQKQITIDGTTKSLTKLGEIAANELADGHEIYVDEQNNMYYFLLGTNTLSAYRPNTQGLHLGNTAVDTEAALSCAEEFLARLGYQTTNFVLTHSGEEATTFGMEYRYFLDGIATDERLLLTLKADSQDNVYVVDFFASDYGVFSATTNTIHTNVSVAQANTLKLQLADSAYTIEDEYLCKDEAGTIYLKTFATVLSEDGTTETQVIKTYLN